MAYTRRAFLGRTAAATLVFWFGFAAGKVASYYGEAIYGISTYGRTRHL